MDFLRFLDKKLLNKVSKAKIVMIKDLVNKFPNYIKYNIVNAEPFNKSVILTSSQDINNCYFQLEININQNPSMTYIRFHKTLNGKEVKSELFFNTKNILFDGSLDFHELTKSYAMFFEKDTELMGTNYISSLLGKMVKSNIIENLNIDINNDTKEITIKYKEIVTAEEVNSDDDEMPDDSIKLSTKEKDLQHPMVKQIPFEKLKEYIDELLEPEQISMHDTTNLVKKFLENCSLGIFEILTIKPTNKKQLGIIKNLYENITTKIYPGSLIFVSSFYFYLRCMENFGIQSMMSFFDFTENYLTTEKSKIIDMYNETYYNKVIQNQAILLDELGRIPEDLVRNNFIYFMTDVIAKIKNTKFNFPSNNIIDYRKDFHTELTLNLFDNKNKINFKFSINVLHDWFADTKDEKSKVTHITFKAKSLIHEDDNLFQCEIKNEEHLTIILEHIQDQKILKDNLDVYKIKNYENLTTY